MHCSSGALNPKNLNPKPPPVVLAAQVACTFTLSSVSRFRVEGSWFSDFLVSGFGSEAIDISVIRLGI